MAEGLDKNAEKEIADRLIKFLKESKVNSVDDLNKASEKISLEDAIILAKFLEEKVNLYMKCMEDKSIFKPTKTVKNNEQRAIYGMALYNMYMNIKGRKGELEWTKTQQKGPNAAREELDLKTQEKNKVRDLVQIITLSIGAVRHDETKFFPMIEAVENYISEVQPQILQAIKEKPSDAAKIIEEFEKKETQEKQTVSTTPTQSTTQAQKTKDERMKMAGKKFNKAGKWTLGITGAVAAACLLGWAGPQIYDYVSTQYQKSAKEKIAVYLNKDKKLGYYEGNEFKPISINDNLNKRVGDLEKKLSSQKPQVTNNTVIKEPKVEQNLNVYNKDTVYKIVITGFDENGKEIEATSEATYGEIAKWYEMEGQNKVIFKDPNSVTVMNDNINKNSSKAEKIGIYGGDKNKPEEYDLEKLDQYTDGKKENGEITSYSITKKEKQ